MLSRRRTTRPCRFRGRVSRTQCSGIHAVGAMSLGRGGRGRGRLLFERADHSTRLWRGPWRPRPCRCVVMSRLLRKTRTCVPSRNPHLRVMIVLEGSSDPIFFISASALLLLSSSSSLRHPPAAPGGHRLDPRRFIARVVRGRKSNRCPGVGCTDLGLEPSVPFVVSFSQRSARGELLS